jgi:ATP-binding cassette subfamily B protein/subfamily B ATP-binding cassette protein MsbA
MRFLRRFKEMNKTWISSVIFAHTRGSVRRFTIYLAIFILFLYGSYLVRNNELSVGEFVAFYLYFFIVMNALTFIVTLTTEQYTLMFQAQRLYNFYKRVPDVQEPENPRSIANVKGEIIFKNVFFSYPAHPQVINGVSFHIEAGQNVALVGESGCGKSTLLKLLGRFYDVDQGEILLDGISIRDLSFAELRSSIGYVFQETYLFGTSIFENIRFGRPDASEEEIIEAAKRAFAHEFILELPDGYNTLIGERGYKLSGGQKQRIAIARMFVKNPVILLLDEATSALDNISEAKVQQALTELSKNRTTITVAHRLSTVQNSDKIIVLDRGKVVEEGTYDQLMQKKGSLYRLIHGNLITVEGSVE